MTIYTRDGKGNTEYYVILPDGNQLKEVVDWPEKPTHRQIKKLVEEQIEGYLQHILVWHHLEGRDMFIDADAVIRKKPRNEVATEIYRAYTMFKHPGTDPNTLAYVLGTAVLFGRRIWRWS